MRSRFLQILALGAALTAATAASPPAEAAGWTDRYRVAQACLSPQQAYAAVQSGQAAPLSTLIARIRSAVGGQILPQPQLCQSGSGLVYRVNVLTGGGQVIAVTVDAASGNILSY